VAYSPQWWVYADTWLGYPIPQTLQRSRLTKYWGLSDCDALSLRECFRTFQSAFVAHRTSAYEQCSTPIHITFQAVVCACSEIQFFAYFPPKKEGNKDGQNAYLPKFGLFVIGPCDDLLSNSTFPRLCSAVNWCSARCDKVCREKLFLNWFEFSISDHCLRYCSYNFFYKNLSFAYYQIPLRWLLHDKWGTINSPIYAKTQSFVYRTEWYCPNSRDHITYVGCKYLGSEKVFRDWKRFGKADLAYWSLNHVTICVTRGTDFRYLTITTFVILYC
jgi:hypothetical protein